MCLDAVSDTSSTGALAGDVIGVDDGVDESGVTDDGLVVHDPNVDESAVKVHCVEWLLCVVCKHVLSSFFGG